MTEIKRYKSAIRIRTGVIFNIYQFIPYKIIFKMQSQITCNIVITGLDTTHRYHSNRKSAQTGWNADVKYMRGHYRHYVCYTLSITAYSLLFRICHHNAIERNHAVSILTLHDKLVITIIFGIIILLNM